MDFYDFVGFYTAGREKERSSPWRWIVVELIPPDNSYIFCPRYVIAHECQLGKGDELDEYFENETKYRVFLVQNNLDSQAILDYVKQWYDGDTYIY